MLRDPLAPRWSSATPSVVASCAVRISIEETRDPDRSEGSFSAEGRELGISPVEAPGSDLDRVLARERIKQRLFPDERARTTLGRYLLLERIGAGGMGFVYGAYDPQLDRKVALKLLSPAILNSAEARRRFEREAQSLAKISDPNVVVVHDVGEVPRTALPQLWAHDEGVEDVVSYIAMELVVGRPLGQWSRDRSWREILDVACQAARGLAAVHAAGLVHRDVKPDNVMVGDDPDGGRAIGRVRVMDLGLARAEGVTDSLADGSLPADSDASPALDEPLTVAGALIGTPAYMAPEHFSGGAIDARTDQFSFCVMLWEAFYGTRPFQGRSFAELAEAIAEHRFSPAARVNPRRVPEWIGAVLQRGLALEPADRWPDVRALLRALERDPTRTRRRRVTAAVALATVALAGGLWQAERNAKAAECVRLGAAASELWQATRASVRDAVLATARPWKNETWTRVDAQMHDWAQGWSHARAEACTVVDAADASERVAAQQVATCQQLQLRRFDALAQTLVETTNANLEFVSQAVAQLPRLERCANPTWMAAIVAEQELLDRVDVIRDAIASADAHGHAGLLEAARAASATTMQDARELGVAPALAEALQSAAQWAAASGDSESAETLFTEAYSVAGKAGYDDVALGAATSLVKVVGIDRGRFEAGSDWVRQAEMFSGRLGVEQDGRGAAVLAARGQLANRQGDYAAAQTDLEAALAIRERIAGPNSLAVADTLQSLGHVLEARSDFDEALAVQQRALAIHREILGPDHPTVARTLLGLTNAYWGAGDLDTAVATALTAMAVAERAVGPDHPSFGSFLMTVGTLHMNRAELDQAEPYLVRAVAAYEGTRGPLHASTGNALFNLAELHRRSSRWSLADGAYRRAQAAFRASLPPEHPNLAMIERGLGAVAGHRGDFVESLAHHREALARFERAHGSAHIEVAKEHVSLSHAFDMLDASRDAIEHAQLAVELLGKLDGAQDLELSYALEALADALLSAADYVQAEQVVRRALALREASLGADSFELETLLAQLARVDRAAARTESAIADHRRALRLIEAAFGPDHARSASHWCGLGETLLETRRFADARDALEHGERIANDDADQVGPLTHANCEIALARALWDKGGDHARARALAAAATRRLHDVTGPLGAAALAAIERWQREHGGPLADRSSSATRRTGSRARDRPVELHDTTAEFPGRE
jgi:eukaryotic-like serine/threonine-protein kinase